MIIVDLSESIFLFLGENFSLLERQRFAIYLIDQYLVDFDSQHCTPLPPTYFRLPNRHI